MDDLQVASQLLGVDAKFLQPFDTTDPFNNGLRLEGLLSQRPDHRYGGLALLRVGGEPAVQAIYATPKVGYPFGKDGRFHFPPIQRVHLYEKLDGTNVLAYRYRDAGGLWRQTYKLRLAPTLRNSKWGPFLDFWQELLAKYPPIGQLVEVNRWHVSFEMYGARKQSLLGGSDRGDFFVEVRPVQIAQPHGIGASDLVAIARADAAERGADAFTDHGAGVDRSIFLDVPRKDDVNAIAEHQIPRRVDPALSQRIDLGQNRGRVEHHAGSDHVHHPRIENSTGNVMQFVNVLAHDDGMTGVGPALLADNDVKLRGQQIDELTLGLVAPLQSNHTRSRHRGSPYSERFVT